ncbi:MAG: hypothetical protein O2960_15610 [Verrucomicrobia bacterium]|nr:hypothetical protein [Verrucomicrobiota bacterium]
MSVDDACDDLPTPGWRDFTATAAKLLLVHAYNQIALAKRFPIKSVGPIQDDFGGGRHAHTTLGGTEQDFDKRFVGDAKGVRDDHARMLAMAGIV